MPTTLIVKKGAGAPSPESLQEAELALDVGNGALYSKLEDGSVVRLNDGAGDGGTGSSVHIGDTPPVSPEEGQQWMEVPVSGDATMWIYDGGKWLQQPGGKDGAPGQNGADGNIADATEQGVVATWDNTAQQWTPDSSLTIDASGDASFSSDISIGSGSASAAEARYATLNVLGDDKDFGSRIFMSNPTNSWAVTSFGGAGSNDLWSIYSFNQAKNVLQINGDTGNATFSGSVTADQDVFGRAFRCKTGLHGSHQPHTFNIEWRDPAIHLWIDATDKGAITTTRMLNEQFIDVLHTLREATKDESTIKGLRDAIGNAVGGLIEKFEAMQASTQEISDE